MFSWPEHRLTRTSMIVDLCAIHFYVGALMISFLTRCLSIVAYSWRADFQSVASAKGSADSCRSPRRFRRTMIVQTHTAATTKHETHTRIHVHVFPPSERGGSSLCHLHSGSVFHCCRGCSRKLASFSSSVNHDAVIFGVRVCLHVLLSFRPQYST